MLLIECNKIKKYYADRLILETEGLKIYSGDKIGIVGSNGAGKTTLLDILSKRLEPDEGFVKIYGKAGYISQLKTPENLEISDEFASKFSIESKWKDSMSGGEKTKFKVAAALEENNLIIFADEPTSNVDIESISLMEEMFAKYKGTFVVISHDRIFLDNLCNKIIEVEDGKVRSFEGNYSNYYQQKKLETERAEFEYQKYINEKKRLEKAVIFTKEKSRGVRNAPRRMGNSEARLHKMGNQSAKKNLDNAVKNMQKRIEHLETKEKVKRTEKIKLDIQESFNPPGKILIEGHNINKSFGEKVLFENADFYIENSKKIALIGHNGCGKSTLLKMIIEGNENIRIAPSARIGYFSQDYNILDHKKSIIENIMDTSIFSESFSRTLLSRLLFKGDSIYKKVNVLSGGELAKVSFAKILLSDANLLILDEPTNYLDVNSLEAIEEAFIDYNKTLLFVSHDRHFIKNIANQIMWIEDKKINLFNGTYEEYLENLSKPQNINKDLEEKIMVLQSRLAAIIGKLSATSKKDNPEKLEQEYKEALFKLNSLKSQKPS
jgi:macrolide transport system ATP-binding/permease protein